MTEVMSLEFSKIENKGIKFLGLLMGITAFSCLVLIKDPHNHGEGGDDHAEEEEDGHEGHGHKTIY